MFQLNLLQTDSRLERTLAWAEHNTQARNKAETIMILMIFLDGDTRRH